MCIRDRNDADHPSESDTDPPENATADTLVDVPSMSSSTTTRRQTQKRKKSCM